MACLGAFQGAASPGEPQEAFLEGECQAFQVVAFQGVPSQGASFRAFLEVVAFRALSAALACLALVEDAFQWVLSWVEHGPVVLATSCLVLALLLLELVLLIPPQVDLVLQQVILFLLLAQLQYLVEQLELSLV